jgi:glycosyl transferase family 25
MKFFITHYTPLVERKKHIIQEMRKANILDYEFIEMYDREHMSRTDVAKFSRITSSETSLFLKHIAIYKKELDDIVVVLEDDAILVDNFKEKLDVFLTELSSTKWDVLFSAECCELHAKSVPNKIMYESNTSRGTCMYVLNKGVSTKLSQIVQAEKGLYHPIDHWFNFIKPKYNLKYFWSEPTLVDQGSGTGLFETSLRST